MADLLNRVGRSAFSYLSGQDVADNGFIGSIVEVDNLQVQITKQLGEGGYAFIYAAKDVASGKTYALKRFLVHEESKVNEVVQEISLMKQCRDHGDFVKFVTAASVDHSVGKKISKEFLLLMEVCSNGDMAGLLRKTGESLSPDNVCVVMGTLVRSLQHLHTKSTPVIHRDIKLENLLLTEDLQVKLCDLGSASIKQHYPDQNWTMNQRTLLEDELAKYSTPMYRAPEMLDTWSNFPINQAVDIWAAGLVLYTLCFNKHPFDDSNKLAIVNGNYKIPASDSRYRMYHPLIKSMLSLDPRSRPTSVQLLDQLSAVAETHGFKTRGSLNNINIHTPTATPLVTPTVDLPPRLPDGPTLISPESQPASSNVAMFKASAGSLFSKLKDTTKSVVNTVQSSMVGRELDFHCITSRVAAMSLPAEGLESAYRNHIDDVRAMMESKHSGHYTVYNVSERQSNPTKYPSGQLVEAGWPAASVPSLDSSIELCGRMLDYLSRDMRNVVVVYCLDGKSSTGYIVCALLLYSGLVSSVDAAIAIFSAKRCDPVLTSCQYESLKHFATLTQSKPPVLKSPFVTITNVVIEPVPLFNKAGDGCRPYVEVYQAKERVISTVQDYNRMKGYCVTSGDEDIVIPVNVTVCGDVSIIINHARQVLGSIKPVKMCQVQFHSSSLTPGRPCYQWKLAQLDCVAEPARFSDNFQLVLNTVTSEECSGKDVNWPDTSAAMLLFNSEQDYDFVKSLIPSKSSNANGPPRPTQVTSQNQTSKFYVNNPDIDHDASSPGSVTKSASSDSSSIDLLGLSSTSVPSATASKKEDSLISGLSDFAAPQREIKNGQQSSNLNLLDPTPPASSSNATFDFLGDLGASSSSNQASKNPVPPKPASASNNISDLFGGSGSGLSAPILNATSINQPSMPRGSSQPDIKKQEERFDPFGNFGDLAASLSSQNLSKQQPAPPMNQTNSSSNFSNMTKPQQPQQQPMGPNYSRSFFSSDNSSSTNNVGGVKPKVSSNAFDDLLGGFTPSSRDANQNQSIGAMKKVELVKAMDPDEAKIFEWREGKARNIRTLLCSLHKIIWQGARWSECGMHQLVSTGDVKKMYRKACLAVHPDKQMGTENENLSKLIFMELNEAWSEFENDPNQQNMFG